MTDSTEMKSLSVPVWDGKAESCTRYIVQIKALTEYYDCSDTLDATKMENCLIKSEFIALGTTDTNHIVKAKLYKANKKCV